jgi:hypothetical protein
MCNVIEVMCAASCFVLRAGRVLGGQDLFGDILHHRSLRYWRMHIVGGIRDSRREEGTSTRSQYARQAAYGCSKAQEGRAV